LITQENASAEAPFKKEKSIVKIVRRQED